jgi:hypothetical protein
MYRPLALVSTAAVLTVSALMSSGASAAPLGGRLPINDLNPVQNVAICFYVDGWNGPGLYDCGFRHRRGYGWHGRREGHNDRGRGDHREGSRDHDGRDPGNGRERR